MNDAYPMRWRGRQFGPLSLEEINRRLDDHELGLGHEIFFEENWTTLGEFLALQRRPPAVVRASESAAPLSVAAVKPAVSAPLPASQPAPSAAPEQSAVAALRPRRRLIYALLGALVGFTGAHNYYARHWITGVLQLLLTLATILLGFGIIVPWLWALFETVTVRRDGAGLEML
jgi:TM2 domain-containing membrane protein YozV